MLPTLILIFGKNYQNYSYAVWITIGVFFDILSAIEIRRIKSISREEIASLLLYFKTNCWFYGLDGIIDKTFHTVFPDIKRQELMLDLFTSLSQDEKCTVLKIYLKRCDLSNDVGLNVVNRIINSNFYGFGQELFSQFSVVVIHDVFFPLDNSEKEVRFKILENYYNYVSTRFLISKTWRLVLEEAMKIFHDY